ncbi:hypothetical protein ID866_9555 [Astraeus odoratus]|nr:hypothetical protein ID866_9555 [Astraeus odoratus]
MTQIIGIANGLVYLHNHECGPVIHGDLKGANVLISDDGHALLTDFGGSHLVNSTLRMSVSLAFTFTLNWMPPEMLDQSSPSVEGDVWSFGMTMLVCRAIIPPPHLSSRVYRSCLPETGHTMKSVTRGGL